MSDLDETGNRGGGGVAEYWYWGGISSAQLLWAISSFRKGYSGDGRLMPIKAFAVASLFVGAAASASFGCLRSSGIRSVNLCFLLLSLELSIFIYPEKTKKKFLDC